MQAPGCPRVGSTDFPSFLARTAVITFLAYGGTPASTLKEALLLKGASNTSWFANTPTGSLL